MVNEYYNEILTAISEHKDFGKRNPIDIGIELGYPEEDIMEMIRGISEEEIEEDIDEDSKPNKYFLVSDDRFGTYILSLNIKNWNIQKVQELEKYDEVKGMFDIHGNLLVWQDKRTASDYEAKYLQWENLETGEQNKILTDASIIKFKILKTGKILIITTDEIIIWDGKKDRKIYEPQYIEVCQEGTIIEGKNCVYFLSQITSSIYKANKDWEITRIWDGDKEAKGFVIGVAEYIDDQLYWWCYSKVIDEGIVFEDEQSTSENKYRKYSEREGYIDNKAPGFYTEKINYGEGVLEAIHTKNYRLMQNEIWSINNKHKLCDFVCCPDLENNNLRQIISIKNKDIFIGLTTEKDIFDFKESMFIKIDLRKEREVTKIPISSKIFNGGDFMSKLLGNIVIEG